MALMDFMRASRNQIHTPYANTGTMLDIATGKFRRSIDGHMYLDGGLSPCFGIGGESQTYKSNIAGSFFANALLLHPKAEGWVYETEGNVAGAERYDDFVSSDTPISDRIIFNNSALDDLSLDTFYKKFSEMVEEKLANKKEYVVDSPFINPVTNEPLKMWIPTFVLIDSYSRARSNKGDQQFKDNNISDSSMNTMWMSEGNVKSKLLSDLPSRASKAGIYVIMTAHVGANGSMDTYAPPRKQMQWMRQSDKLKNVGSNFTFLTTSLIQTMKATCLQDSKKECMYPLDTSNPREINQVDTNIVRSKNNMSGGIIPFIASQTDGILNAVTSLIYLKDNNEFGLTVKGANVTPVLKPDTTFNRKTIRAKSNEDYKLERALELTAQLCFIQKMWNLRRLPSFFNVTPEDFAEVLYKDQGQVDRILNSTGSWSTSTQGREVLSLFDVLGMLYDANSPLLRKTKKK